MFKTYSYSCITSEYHKDYRLTEPGLYFILQTTLCKLDKESFYKFIIAVQVTLLLLVLLSFKSLKEKLYFIIFLLLFAEFYDFYHLFKQHSATLLIVLAYSLKNKFLWVIGFMFHNAGSLITFLSLRSYKSTTYLLISVLSISICLAIFRYNQYLSGSYNFIYQIQPGNYSLFLVKYFLFSAFLFVIVLIITERKKYFNTITFFITCGLSLIILQSYYENNQLAFRIFICIKGIICTYILAQALPRLSFNYK